MKTAEATTFRPTEPTDRPDPRVWRRTRSASGKQAFALGSLAVVEETTGAALLANQRWAFRVKFGSERSAAGFKRDDAMRQAEFALGIGECAVEPFQLPKNSL